MKSKKLQARAPNLNSGNNKHDTGGNDEGHGGTTGEGGGGSRSGCPSTVSSLDSGAPSQHPNALPPPYSTGGGGGAGGAYPGAPQPFHFSSSMKIDPSKSPGQQSDGKDSVNNDFAQSANNSQLSVINPFEPPKLQPPPSAPGGPFDPSRRFNMPYPDRIHMPPPPPPFNSSSVGGAIPFQLPQFLQHPQQQQQQSQQPPRTREVWKWQRQMSNKSWGQKQPNETKSRHSFYSDERNHTHKLKSARDTHSYKLEKRHNFAPTSFLFLSLSLSLRIHIIKTLFVCFAKNKNTYLLCPYVFLSLNLYLLTIHIYIHVFFSDFKWKKKCT